jgi:hypothetical protein
MLFAGCARDFIRPNQMGVDAELFLDKGVDPDGNLDFVGCIASLFLL